MRIADIFGKYDTPRWTFEQAESYWWLRVGGNNSGSKETKISTNWLSV